MRKVISIATLLVGLGVATGSFFLAMPNGAPGSPIMPFSPLVFVVGVILMILSAALYELFPGSGRGVQE